MEVRISDVKSEEEGACGGREPNDRHNPPHEEDPTKKIPLLSPIPPPSANEIRHAEVAESTRQSIV